MEAVQRPVAEVQHLSCTRSSEVALPKLPRCPSHPSAHRNLITNITHPALRQPNHPASFCDETYWVEAVVGLAISISTGPASVQPATMADDPTPRMPPSIDGAQGIDRVQRYLDYWNEGYKQSENRVSLRWQLAP